MPGCLSGHAGKAWVSGRKLAGSAKKRELAEVDVKRVSALLAVMEEGSISAAARRLRVTQPALSRQIRALEEELGVELLMRGAHSVTPTAAGRKLEIDGRKWLAMGEQVRKRVVAAGRGEVLRVAYAPSLAGPLLGPALERFGQFHADVRIELSDLSSSEMKGGLLTGTQDLILAVPDDSDSAGIHWEKIESRPIMLAVGVSHRLSAELKIPASELVNERLLMFGREEYPDYWKLVGRYFEGERISPKVVGEFDAVSSLMMAVEAGIGVAMVAEAGASLPHGVKLLRLDPDPPGVCISAGWLREPSPPCRVLIEELKRCAQGR